MLPETDKANCDNGMVENANHLWSLFSNRVNPSGDNPCVQWWSMTS